ncbi:MAG: YHS domain-containing protein [Cyclobacteriaceae bacterium]
MILLLTLLLTFPQQSNHLNKNKKDVMIGGWDVVSYHNDQPIEGSENISSTYQGGTYFFASTENKNLFDSDPDKYVPAYGGWCAYAMGDDGSKVKIHPESYKIIEGRLYLFYNFWGTDTLEMWNEDEKNLKEKADSYWADIIKS